jgi:hypothetical protein
MKKKLYELTEQDIEVLKASTENPNLFFDYFFRKPGHEHGWQLDANFDDSGKWQESMCMATQAFIVAINGICTGKTLGVIMSAAYHGVLTPGFKFMNVAKEVYQSMLMFKAFLEQAEGTLFEQLIINSPKRPYPQVIVAFMAGGIKHTATFEFMSLGEKGDATNIFSYRGDWANIEEAGLIDNLGDIVSNLSTRLNGVSADGREYLGRLTIISNPWENPELWQLFDMALADKQDGLAFNIDTSANKNATDRQIRMSMKLIPEKDQSRFLTGGRPEGKGNYFSRANVNACENDILNNLIKEKVSTPMEGWNIVQIPNLGVMLMQMPRQDSKQYFLIGDPGTGAAPRRNAPTIIVFETSDAPTYAPIVAFWWGNGGGSIYPFVDKFIEWMDYYKPMFAGVDNTGPQKSTAELITTHYVMGQNKSVEAITGLDFSGAKKYAYLGALRMSLESHMFQWAPIIKGISTQLKNYDPIVDKAENSKLAQDIVSVLAMGAFAIRAWFPAKPKPSEDEDREGTGQPGVFGRSSRSGGARRGAIRTPDYRQGS